MPPSLIGTNWWRNVGVGVATTLALAALLALGACGGGPGPVVFIPAPCAAQPCGDPVTLVGDFTNRVPEYPEIMRVVGIEGRVEAEFVVTPEGTVDPESVVIRSSTNKSFERNSMLAIDRWRFATRDGRAPTRPTRYAVRIEYRLNPRPASTAVRLDPGGHAWSMDDDHPVLTVTSSQNPRIPRSQVRPMDGGSR